MRQTKQIESFSPFNWDTELTQNQTSYGTIYIVTALINRTNNRALDCCNYSWHWVSIVSQLPLQTNRFIYEPKNDHLHRTRCPCITVYITSFHMFSSPGKNEEFNMSLSFFFLFFALLFLLLNRFYFCLEII